MNWLCGWKGNRIEVCEKFVVRLGSLNGSGLEFFVYVEVGDE